MNKDWSECTNILCIRPDNMGDLLMSTPAIRALKETFKCRITVLTSSMAGAIARQIKEIDEVLVFDLPWVKLHAAMDQAACKELIERIRAYSFDAAVVFTVCSQNPLPTVMLAYLAGIPKRLSYCRENPYGLLTDWIPDPEPYQTIRHQVRRDLDLVAAVGAASSSEQLSLHYSRESWASAQSKLNRENIPCIKPFIILHTGVSEKKREYPKEYWIELGQKIADAVHLPMLLTGVAVEKRDIDVIQQGIGEHAFSLAGLLSLNEFIALVKNAVMVISVNTGTIHIAAAMQTPVIVLYALTNPQHLPWKVHGKAFLFDIPEGLKSRNEVIRYMDEHLMPTRIEPFSVNDVMLAIHQVLSENEIEYLPELIPLRSNETAQ